MDSVLRAVEDARVAVPTLKSLGELVEDQVARTPDAVAVQFEGEQLTYHQLNERANQVAHHLRELGVTADVCVGISMERSMEMVISVLAVLKAGGAYVPLDPAYPTERLALMLRDARAAVLLTQHHLVDHFPRHDVTVLCLDRQEEAIRRKPGTNPVGIVTPANLAYVIYTSGSTGTPKGIAMTHGVLANLILWQRDNTVLHGQAKTLQFTSLSFDVSFQEIFSTWCAGGVLVLVRDEIRRDAFSMLSYLQQESIERLFLPFVALHHLAEAAEAYGPIPHSLREVVTAGEQLRIDRHLANLFTQLPECRLYNQYGPAECHVVTSYTLPPSVDAWPTLPAIGKPIAHTKIYLLDEARRPAPDGEAGELYIGGIAVARGYLHRPELTAERFVEDPFDADPEARLYKTGDLARRLPDGNIEYLGRMDHQVKIRGFRVEPGEVETALCQHPAVQEAVVVDRADGSDQRRLVAYIKTDPRYTAASGNGAAPDLQAAQLAQWKMVWNDTYSQENEAPDPTFNISGWKSSYTGLPLAEAHMREWAGHVVDRIIALSPGRVLELGCGLGLILFQVAPRCERYVGADFSPVALDYIRRQLERTDVDLPQVELLERRADDLADLADDTFDVVVLNSVTQHFTSVEYLVRVLEGAARVVAPGGSIFVGDVTNRKLRDAFFTSVELHKAPASLSRAHVRERVNHSLNLDQELVIDPAFFEALVQHIPAVSHAEIQLKRGRLRNELAQFRYDVVLHVGNDRAVVDEMRWLGWEEAGGSVPALRRYLQEAEPAVLGVQGVPNARLRAAMKAWAYLNRSDGPSTAGELRRLLQASQTEGVEPEDLWALQKDLPYVVQITWSRAGADDCFDVCFRRRSPAGERASKGPFVFHNGSTPQRPLNTYTSHPMRGIEARQAMPQFRAFLQDRLPEYMVPSAFVLLDQLPLTPSGKVDRRALPAPENKRPPLSQSYVAPQTDLEVELAAIWRDLLLLDRVGIHDNFFELGGNSLLSFRAITRVRQMLQVHLPVVKLFQYPTIHALARHLSLNGAEEDGQEDLDDRARRQQQAFARQKHFRRRR